MPTTCGGGPTRRVGSGSGRAPRKATWGGQSIADSGVVFERCALVFDHGVLGYPFVETRLGFYVADPSGLYFRGLRPVGHYQLITLLDGTDDDNYFVLDAPRHAKPDAAPHDGDV